MEMDPLKSNDIKKYCRICLKIQPHMRFLSNSELINGKFYTLSQMLKSCTSIQIVLNEESPNMICQACIKRLYLSWGFKVDCEKSEATLQQNLNNKRKREQIANLSTNSSEITQINTASNSNESNLKLVRVFSVQNNTNKVNNQEESFSERARNFITANLDKILNESSNQFNNNNININNTPTAQNSPNNHNIAQNKQILVKVGIENEDPQTQKFILVNRKVFNQHNNTNVQDPENKTLNENIVHSETQEKNQTIKNESTGVNISKSVSRELIDLTILDSDENEPNVENIDDDDNNNNKKQKLNPESYKCFVCDRIFETKENYLMHMKTHTNSKTYTCEICNQQFDIFSNFEIHLKIHIGKNTLKCLKCSKYFASKAMLNSHEKLHNIEDFKCDLCCKHFSADCDVQRHLKQVHSGVNQYFCDVCMEGFTLKIMLKQHRKIHLNNDSFKCNMCGLSFNTFDELSKHNITNAPEILYKCVKCDVAFITEDALKNHQMQHCGKDEHIKCKVCFKIFNAYSALKEHMLTHKKTKSYACKTCERVFSSVSKAKDHSRSHFTCNLCSEAFDNLRLLNIHKKKQCV